MVQLFEILGLGRFKRRETNDIPNFFGGTGPELAWGMVPLSRAEVEACYLAGKAPEPDDIPSLKRQTPPLS